MKILIEKGHIIDPSQGFDGIGDVLIEDGKIKEINVQGFKNSELQTPNFELLMPQACMFYPASSICMCISENLVMNTRKR